jgi:hypothetical protein
VEKPVEHVNGHMSQGVQKESWDGEFVAFHYLNIPRLIGRLSNGSEYVCRFGQTFRADSEEVRRSPAYFVNGGERVIAPLEWPGNLNLRHRHRNQRRRFCEARRPGLRVSAKSDGHSVWSA